MVLQWHLWENPLFKSVSLYAQSSSNYLGYLEFSVTSNNWKRRYKQADFTVHNISRHFDHAIMLHQLPKSPIGILISTVFWVSAFNLQPFMHIPRGPKATLITCFLVTYANHYNSCTLIKHYSPVCSFKHQHTHTLIVWSGLSVAQICLLISLRKASATRN